MKTYYTAFFTHLVHCIFRGPSLCGSGPDYDNVYTSLQEEAVQSRCARSCAAALYIFSRTGGDVEGPRCLPFSFIYILLKGCEDGLRNPSPDNMYDKTRARTKISGKGNNVCGII